MVIENRDGGLLEWWLSLFWDAYLQRLLQKPDGSTSTPTAPPGAEPKGRAPRVMLTAAPPSTAPPAAALAAASASAAAHDGKPQLKADLTGTLIGNTLQSSATSAAAYTPQYKAPAGVRGASFSSASGAGMSASPVQPSGSLYLVPGWPTGYASAAYPPSSPDMAAASSATAMAHSPVTNTTPRSPQTQEAQHAEDEKKRGKRRRSTNASVLLPPAYAS